MDTIMGLGDLMATTVDYILNEYRKIIRARHRLREGAWPVLSGYNVTVGTMGQLHAHIFKHTGNDGIVHSNGIGEIDPAISGVTSIDRFNLETVRNNLARHFRAGLEDAVVFVHVVPDGENYKVGLPDGELERLVNQHEAYMGLSPMKIFLSHKSADKTLLRDFAKTLEGLGFQPWLDEDAMHAGVNLERGLLDGFEQSCAVVFFITENFLDKDYLATEVDYAIRQKRAKGDRYSIITLSPS